MIIVFHFQAHCELLYITTLPDFYALTCYFSLTMVFTLYQIKQRSILVPLKLVMQIKVIQLIL